MSLPETVQVTCPNCRNDQDFVMWRTLNVTLNPEEKEQVLDRSLFSFTCERCGTVSPVLYPMLYHDMKQGLMVQLVEDPASDLSEMEEVFTSGFIAQLPMNGSGEGRPLYRFRVVYDLNELIEKIRLCDDGWDDRMMEFVKMTLRGSLPPQMQDPETSRIYYNSRTEETPGDLHVSFACVEPDGKLEWISFRWSDLGGLPKALGQVFAQADAAMHDRRFRRIDHEYVRSLAEQLR